MASSAALVALISVAKSISLSDITESSIKLNHESFPHDTRVTFKTEDGKTLTHSLISLFLLIQNPTISVFAYKQICKKYKVEDSVKVSDKPNVLKYFSAGSAPSAASAEVEEGSIEERYADKRSKRASDDRRSSSGKDRDRSRKDSRDNDRSRRKDKKHSSSSRDAAEKTSSSAAKKKDTTPITHQQILDNLNTVVDKRSEKTQAQDDVEENDGSAKDMEVTADGGDTVNTDHAMGQVDEPPRLLSPEEEERRAIRACLSAAGYEATKVSKEILEKDKSEVEEKITSYEIPVGNSASVLRCGATTTNASSKRKSSSTIPSSAQTQSARDFTRVLELYNESLKKPRTDKRDPKKPGRHDGMSNSAKQQAKPTGKPIIIVPNAMTSPVSLINSFEFFSKCKFVSREVAVKHLTGPKPTMVTVKRVLPSRFGGGNLEYEIIDNPLRKLQTSKDWDRVVAVIAQGAAWQFKGWKLGRSETTNPVDVFTSSFGYYIGYEGAPVPKELQGWNVKKGFVSRDKRGLDSVVHSNFWNGLDEWMSVHKRDYLPN